MSPRTRYPGASGWLHFYGMTTQQSGWLPVSPIRPEGFHQAIGA